MKKRQIPIFKNFDLIRPGLKPTIEESTQSITPTMMYSSICRWYVFASPLLGKHLKKPNFTYENKDIGLNKRYKVCVEDKSTFVLILLVSFESPLILRSAHEVCPPLSTFDLTQKLSVQF